mgnify:CR=1 FL=1|jgi:hypothetical protein
MTVAEIAEIQIWNKVIQGATERNNKPVDTVTVTAVIEKYITCTGTYTCTNSYLLPVTEDNYEIEI